MAYELTALISRVKTFEAALVEYPVVILPYELALLPLTNTIQHSLDIRSLPLNDLCEIKVYNNLSKLVTSISSFGIVAFIQSDFWEVRVTRHALCGMIKNVSGSKSARMP